MYKVAILDDEKNFLEEIHNCLQEYEMFEVSYFQEAKLLIDEIDYFDVVYIDYEMENMTAFEFFKEIVIHGREEYKIRSTFKDFIKKIKKNDFITISYGILVNMRYVQYINLKEMMVVLENEIQLPLSYKYKNSVKEAY